ncbi:MAG: hypothetical protein RIQ54_479 [Candidatus Parcubacteria bacterium]|jgi:hypothetical protein
MEEIKNDVAAQIESDIVRLAQEVLSRRERIETKDIGDRQLIREALESITPVASSNTSIPVTSSDDSHSPLPAYVQQASPETKLEIEYLLEEAFRKGLLEATQHALASNPFVLDAFRDALAGRLHDELVHRGMLPPDS